MKPLIVFLNGTSSSGKTSIANALQELYPTPLLHTGIDWFYDMLPKQAVGSGPMTQYGYRYIMRNGLLDHIEVGEYAQRLIGSVVPMTGVLIEHGSDIVIDEILFHGERRDFLHAYADTFADARAYFIKIECALEILEAREAQRPDRHRGVARAQFYEVHNHLYSYDFTVDTGTTEPKACAEMILDFMAKVPEPQAFAAIRARKKHAL
ncbi:MAG: chloramphenicol phosphotransferase [Candidatus Dependentiae bacterium]|nr:chloramphenicol phosphotransferase [Candidatus Dependentiae bacterium]